MHEERDAPLSTDQQDSAMNQYADIILCNDETGERRVVATGVEVRYAARRCAIRNCSLADHLRLRLSASRGTIAGEQVTR